MKYVRKFSDEFPYSPSEATRARISKTLKRRHKDNAITSKSNKGFRWSEDQKMALRRVRARQEKRSAHWKGKKLPLETRQKMSVAKRKYFSAGCRVPLTDKHYRSWCSNTRNRVIKRLRVKSLTHTFVEWESLKSQYNITCPCCHRMEPEIRLTEDHIVPLSLGGTDLIENIQPLCLRCNLRKHTRVVKY